MCDRLEKEKFNATVIRDPSTLEVKTDTNSLSNLSPAAFHLRPRRCCIRRSLKFSTLKDASLKKYYFDALRVIVDFVTISQISKETQLETVTELDRTARIGAALYYFSTSFLLDLHSRNCTH